MNINSIIKPEAREEFKSFHRDTDKFVILSGGKLGRKILRNMAKKAIVDNKGKLESPLGKLRSRQERKAMAKALKIAFTPRYNGPVYKYVSGKNEEGNVIKLLTEVK